MQSSKIISFLMLLMLGTSTASMYIPLQASYSTWELLESDYPDAVFTDVTFLNSTHGWIAGREIEHHGSNAIVLHTENGGSSWQLQYNGDTGEISTIDVLNDQTIWVTGSGSLFYSFDGGTTWNESVVPHVITMMSTVKFINMTHGWTSTNGILYHTTDSGQSWDIVEGYTYDDSLRKIQCLTSIDIWAIGFGGIYHSIDGGFTWEKASRASGSAISMVSESEGWAISNSALYHMTGGNHWVEVIVPMRTPASGFGFSGPTCTDILFVDENNGWIVGSMVRYTPDGGANWYHQSTPTEWNQRMMAVDFINQTHGWIVGSDGIIMRTTTGNSLGYRLWFGLTDPLFLSIVTVVVVVGITSSIGIFRIRRRYRRGKSTGMKIKPPRPEIFGQ